MYAYENNFVDSITTACYKDMQYAMTRIAARIRGEKTSS